MSKIDPVYRNQKLVLDPTAGLNDPISTRDTQHPDAVEGVKAAHKTDLTGDRRELVMSVDPESGRLVTKVLDRNSEAVVYQQPPDRILALARELKQQRRGYPATGEVPPAKS